MQDVEVKPFDVIGISIKTTNHGNQALKDISQLWEKFITKNIASQIPNKVDPTVYCAYTDYEGDHNQPYGVVLGCAVSSTDEVPMEMRAIKVNGGRFKKFIAKGNLKKGIIGEEWYKIWQSGLDRAYQVDFEVFDEKATDPYNAEVGIFISMKH